MGSLLWIVWEDFLLTPIADVLCIWTLDLEMVFKVLAVKAHAAALRTGLKLLLTGVDVRQSCTVFVELVTIWALAFEFQ